MSLPSDLTKTQDVISLAAQSPKVSLKEVRPLADKLGFAVLPFEYLADESWEEETYEKQRSIQAFSELKPWFNIYVMTPLDFYSVQKHVKSKEDLPIYSPSFAAQSFMAISMAIPMFRSMRGDIEQLAQNDRRLANQLQSVNEEIKNLKLRVDDLAKAIDQQTREAAAARVREKELIQRLEEYEARFVPLDPMMLAIPKDISIRDAKGHCIVGPFWGPDFPKIVEAALQLEAVEGQRTKLRVGLQVRCPMSEGKLERAARLLRRAEAEVGLAVHSLQGYPQRLDAMNDFMRKARKTLRLALEAQEDS